MYKKQKIHLVGIGGVGMSGIAEVLLNLGYPISGSDLKRSTLTQRLKKMGAQITYGHAADNVNGAEVVVVSSAVKKDNPEVVAAKSQKIPIIQRAEMLAELMRFSKYGIAIAGTHGKTTTTSLIAMILYEAGYDPTMVIGGRVNRFRTNARLGRGDFMVAEADESDGSFLKLSPTIVVITNIDREHMDFYGSFEESVEAYLKFTQRLPFYGVVVACIDHPVVKALIPRIEKKVITYGFSPEAMWTARNVFHDGPREEYELFAANKSEGPIHLNIAGDHNILNSLAAVAVASELNISMSRIRKALTEFKGIGRRCEVLLQTSRVTVIDDYGHHPEEIRATLKAVKRAFQGRLVTLFQPHRYTRTKDLFQEFLTAFDSTDLLLMTEIYPAGEEPIPGIDSERLVKELMAKTGHEVRYLPMGKEIVDEVIAVLKPGDVFLSLGAGNITQIGRECAKRLKEGQEIPSPFGEKVRMRGSG